MALSSNPDANLQSRYEALRPELGAARDIVQAHIPDMSTPHRIAIQVAYTNAIRAQAIFEQAIELPGADTDKLKRAIKLGVNSYQGGLPVLIENKTLFSEEEWTVLTRTNVDLNLLAQDVIGLNDAESLKAAGLKVYQLLKIAADIAL